MTGFVAKKTHKGAEGETVRWYAVYDTPDGRRRWEAGGRLKRDAQSLLRRRQTEIANGEYGRQADITFAELATLYLESIKLEVKPSSWSDYEICVRVHLNPTFGRKKIGNITPADVQRYRTVKAAETRKDCTPYSPRRVNKALTILGAVFKFGVEHGYLRESPTRFIKKVKESRTEMDFLRPDEVRRFLDACDPYFYPIACTAVFTGLRQGELFALKRSDVDLGAKVIRVQRSYHPTHGFMAPKSDRGSRTVDMSPNLADVLLVHMADTGGDPDDLLFRNGAGNPIDYHNVEKRAFHAALKQANLRRVRFHDLRHTFAAMMIASGANIKYIQHQLGHSSISITMDTYGHLLPGAGEGVGAQLDSMIYPDGVKTGGLVVVEGGA
ncbi:MAG: site-specific integrase [Actinobacteria bacterium]|nr:site-specific integrase [Actinomycetota bacterium]MBU1942901.1 site-specific integrase [Actinomycetota bacterium]MBU2687633.1 site-specific integrase [Actinomycetota bacterium]